MPRIKSREFSSKIKETIERRAGHKCSNPGCKRPTSGPNGDSFNKIGEVAHINATSASGPRYDEYLSDEYISSKENGIWLCSFCHKMIDSNADEYPVELLKKWKLEREEEATSEIGEKTVQNVSNFNNNDVILSKLESIEQKISLNNNYYDNYGIGKGVIDQFKEIENYIVNRLFYNKNISKKLNEIDNYLIEVFEWFIGKRNFPSSEIIKLYKKYDNTILDGNYDIIKIKRVAFLNYFNGEIDSCKKKYNLLYKKYDITNEKWIKDDILIDGRNLICLIDNLKGKISKNNKFDDTIARNGYNVQYPYIDRLEKEILKYSIERTNNYKFKKIGTQIYGVGLERIFNNIQKVITISVLYGSFTQILSLRNLVSEILLLYAERLEDEELYEISLNFYLLSSKYNEYKNVLSKIDYKFKIFNTSKYLKRIIALKDSVLIYDIKTFEVFIYDYFGRILNNKEFEIYENKIFEYLKSENNQIINMILKAIPNNIVRSKRIHTLLSILKSKTNNFIYRREIQTVLNYIKYDELSEKSKILLKKIINDIIVNKDYLLITDLLVDIKLKDKTKEFDDVLLKGDNQKKLFYKIKSSSNFSAKNLELIVDELIKRNKITNETKTIISYATNYNIVEDFYYKDTLYLRKIIDTKILSLIDLTISSNYIEVIDKVQMLRNMMFIHFFDNKYDKSLEILLGKLDISETNSAFSMHYNPEILKLYKDLFEYILINKNIDELLNNYLLYIINNQDLFSEIRIIIEFLSKHLKYNDANYRNIYNIINIMLNSNNTNNRENAIKLTSILYHTKYFDMLYNNLYDISINSSYNEMKAVAFVIAEIKGYKNKKISLLKDNIINNENYNIRYIGKRYLTKKAKKK